MGGGGGGGRNCSVINVIEKRLKRGRFVVIKIAQPGVHYEVLG